MKESREIESLLTWAYLHELPKRHISSAEANWNRISQYGYLGGVNTDHGAAQRYPHHGVPHKDAEIIEKAVDALGIADWQHDFEHIAGELAALVSVNELFPKIAKPATIAGKAEVAPAPDGRGVRSIVLEKPRDVLLVRTINVSALVTRHAFMGTRPDWPKGIPQPYQIPGRRGPLISGECRGKNLYTAGSYCFLRWAPSPVEIVLGRADYHVWHQALARLAASLNLSEHRALPPDASPAPWLEGEKVHRVFSYAVANQKPLPLKPQRPRAGAPPKRSRKIATHALEVDRGQKSGIIS